MPSDVSALLANPTTLVLTSGSAPFAHIKLPLPLQVLRAKHAHDLERLAEAEARLRDELAAKDVRDAKAQVSCVQENT